MRSKCCYINNGSPVGFPFSFEAPVRIANGILNNCTIGAFSYTDTPLKNVKMGRYCALATNIENLFDHPKDWLCMSSLHYRQNTFLKTPTEFYEPYETYENEKMVEIGNDVWIGANVKIIGGRKIGTGAIIGANAVVTKDVPDYAIVAGVPAKIIRFRFPPQVIAALLESKWWEFNIMQIKLDVKTPLHAIEQLKEAEAKGLITKYQPRWTHLKSE